MTNETWILVATASRARLFHAGARSKGWELVTEREHPESRAAGHELLADKPGTTRQSGGETSRSSMMDPRTDPKEVEAKKFAHELGKLLAKGVDDGAYHRLVLVAPPQVLGLLRAELEDKVARRVASTLDKDYHELTPKELAERVEL
jgi:protein required for attachment to host cells